jgi:tripartite-type tricarboxylate transporter receptor subunit TctC
MGKSPFPARVFFLAGLILIFPGASGHPADFPAKPIILYSGTSPGSTTYLTARALADEARKELGVPVVVDSKPGAGYTVAATFLANQKPDGYTLGIISSAALDTRHMMLNVAYDPFKDFTYILAYAVFPGGVCVKSDSPFKTLADLLEYARKNSGTLSYSSSGAGAAQQVAVEYLAKQVKTKFKHVPYQGGAPACTALLGGHVDFTAGSGIHLNYVKQGAFRMLAVINSEKREPDFPDVPTLQDLGYKDAPPAAYLLLAPRGLPDAVYLKLDSAFRKAAHSPEFRAVLEKLRVPFVFKDRRQLEGEFPATYQFYRDFLKEAGILIK